MEEINNGSDKENVIDKPNVEEADTLEDELDEDCLAALGADPTVDCTKQVKLHNSISKRWSHWFFKGLKDVEKERLIAKYPAPGNLQPPKLNAEIAAFLMQSSVKRDSHFMQRQKLATSTLAILGAMFNSVIDEKDGVDKIDFVKKINDAAKLIKQLVFDQTEARKAFILPGVDRHKKAILTNTQTDEYVFGSNLKERIKEAKALEKIGQDMKQAGPSRPLRPVNNLNWSGPQTTKPAFLRMGQGNHPANSRPRLFFKNKQFPYNSRVKNQNRYIPRDTAVQNRRDQEGRI
ncbi:uncharacterized protein LOC128881180 [Hylaeus volcanicus]|uniref:uncharacterized protein LOC128881180 n=1 Tax=Hylaeus volcanicus TaxID=313075 RepID=UPI0023B7A5C5|nr:uncharacterized protein LOC128881180 [Hylaeus volcanicus]